MARAVRLHVLIPSGDGARCKLCVVSVHHPWIYCTTHLCANASTHCTLWVASLVAFLDARNIFLHCAHSTLISCDLYCKFRKIARASGSSPGAAALDCEVGYAETASFRCDGAGLTVVYKTKEIGGELYRVKPAVRPVMDWVAARLELRSSAHCDLPLCCPCGMAHPAWGSCWLSVDSPIAQFESLPVNVTKFGMCLEQVFQTENEICVFYGCVLFLTCCWLIQEPPPTL